jgi:hypothetical protein
VVAALPQAETAAMLLVPAALAALPRAGRAELVART